MDGKDLNSVRFNWYTECDLNSVPTIVYVPFLCEQDLPKRNKIRFTSVQVEAIRSGMNPGLTMVVGPPGTGASVPKIASIPCLELTSLYCRWCAIFEKNLIFMGVFSFFVFF